MHLNSWMRNLLVGISLISWPAISEARPKLYGDVRAPECLDAFQLARWAYDSRASAMYAIETIPEDLGSQMVLGSLYRDISGGGALDANEDIFERLPHENRGIYWQKSALHGRRIVVQEDAMGWRGDRYSLYVLSSAAAKDDFAKQDRGEYQITGESPLLEESWRPPLVLKHKETSRLWFIVMGEPYQILADWRVYLHLPDGYRQECKISFHDFGEAKEIPLPNSVQRLAMLLDQTIGPGAGEGTLQSTARIRVEVRRVWANAALRPWALTDRDRYNSKSEVDAGLEAWSSNGPSYSEVYRKIQSTYPAAEKDLARYYRNTFRLSSPRSQALAKWVLEILYCAHYKFTNGANYFRYDNVDDNPWKSIHGK